MRKLGRDANPSFGSKRCEARQRIDGRGGAVASVAAGSLASASMSCALQRDRRAFVM
jgi:hypothetical protein